MAISAVENNIEKNRDNAFEIKKEKEKHLIITEANELKELK